jgi:hypothetical protein
MTIIIILFTLLLLTMVVSTILGKPNTEIITANDARRLTSRIMAKPTDEEALIACTDEIRFFAEVGRSELIYTPPNGTLIDNGFKASLYDYTRIYITWSNVL